MFVCQTSFSMETLWSVLSAISEGDFVILVDLQDAYFEVPFFQTSRKYLCFFLYGAAISWLVFPASYMICLSPFFKNLTLLVVLTGGSVGYMLNMASENYNMKSLEFYPVTLFSGSMWFLPFLSTLGVGPKWLKMGAFYHQVSDSGWSEYYGGQGIYTSLSDFSKKLQIIQENSIKVYLSMMLIWMAGFLLMI